MRNACGLLLLPVHPGTKPLQVLVHSGAESKPLSGSVRAECPFVKPNSLTRVEAEF